jgi:hypothetical protein
MKIKEKVEEMINKGLKLVPCLPGTKKPFINGWEKKTFSIEDFNKEDLNIGINIGLSEIVDIDIENEQTSFFARQFLSPNTLMFGVKKKDYVIPTHYLYKNTGLKYEKKTFSDGKIIAELRVDGQTICPPSKCPSKLNSNVIMERHWINDSLPSVDENLFINFRKMCAATALHKYIDSDNLDMVMLASCLKKYTDWSFEDRTLFINRIVNGVVNKHNQRIFNWKDIYPKILSVESNWDKEDKKKAGYKAFANQVKMDESYSKEVFSWIGTVEEFQENENKGKKKIIDFISGSMKEVDFTKNVEMTYLVRPIIPEFGLTILAGRPKSNKSFMAMDLAYSVQNPNGKFLGMNCMEGDVLLLSLEDNELSMNHRVKSMKNEKKIKPITFVHQCPQINFGFEESVDNWCQQVKNPKLVIIDTFQKIKPMGGSKNANAYEIDYYFLGKLHSLALTKKILIMYLHHLSQASKEYSWDKIMGSTGHQGVTDAMYMLDREEVGNKATFRGKGRNIIDFKYDLEWNTNQDCRFTNQGSSYIKEVTESKKMIYLAFKELAKEKKFILLPSDIAKFLNKASRAEKGHITQIMLRMKKKLELLNGGEKYGSYKLPFSADLIDEEGNLRESDLLSVM